MYRIKKEKLKERKEMNLKTITNLALLCKLCATEEEFYLDKSMVSKYKFENGILMVILDTHIEKTIMSYFTFNDLINKDIKEVNSND